MSILSLKKIYYKSGEKDILKDISLDIDKGECISIVGSSGSGKSTFLKMLSDLISASGGNIYFNGKDYKEYNPIELRRLVSYCVQIPVLFGKTVYDNLKFPFEIRGEKVDNDKIRKLLKAFNLGEDTLNQKIELLSGGEKQRVAIIRNLIYLPEILLLDEVTSALDEQNSSIVENYIREINNMGVTVIWVTHNEKQSRSIFTKRITMSEGQILDMEEIA